VPLVSHREAETPRPRDRQGDGRRPPGIDVPGLAPPPRNRSRDFGDGMRWYTNAGASPQWLKDNRRFQRQPGWPRISLTGTQSHVASLTTSGGLGRLLALPLRQWLCLSFRFAAQRWRILSAAASRWAAEKRRFLRAGVGASLFKGAAVAIGAETVSGFFGGCPGAWSVPEAPQWLGLACLAPRLARRRCGLSA
jgi:hypothetical protein